MGSGGLFGKSGEEKAGSGASEGGSAEGLPSAYIEKQVLPVVVYTTNRRIEGLMHVPYHHRALDVLNGPEPFIPITKARIYDLGTDVVVAEQDFVAVSKNHLVFLYEAGKPRPPHSESGDEAGANRPS